VAAQYKRRYHFGEAYEAVVLLPRAMRGILAARRAGSPNARFVERLMLAVTEVNGCAVCSYAHARMALEQGMPQEEIDSFLNGDGTKILPQEATAILFAQHYADSKGRPDRAAFSRLEQVYGSAVSHGILSAIQVMMVGNIVGIPISALISRRKGFPYPGSSIAYEILMAPATLLSLPFALLHALVRWIVRLPNLRFGATVPV